VQPAPFLDMTSGYVQRAIDHLPKQGNKAPWKLFQNYAIDMNLLRRGKIEDGAMVFSKPTRAQDRTEAPRKARTAAAAGS
jgi:hypothetical protein